MPLQACQTETPADRARSAAQRRHQTDRQPGEQQEGQQRRAEAGDKIHAEARVSGHPEHHADQNDKTKGVGQEVTPGRHPPAIEFAAQHTQRRHPLQLHERRHGKAEEQQHPGRQPLKRRNPARRGKRIGQQFGQPGMQDMVGKVAEQTAEGRRRQPQNQKLQQVRPHQQRLGGAKAAHHRAGIEVALHVTARRECNGNGGEDDGQDGGDAEKALRAFECGSDLRPRVIDVLDPLPRREFGLNLGVEAFDLRRVAGHQQAMDDPAAGTDQTARLQVIEADHHPRRDAEEIDAAIRFLGQDRLDDQGRPADGDRVADPDPQRRRSALFQPDGPGRGNPLGHFIADRHPVGGLLRTDAQHSAQGIARTHRFDLAELDTPRFPFSGAHHARESLGGGHPQTEPFGGRAQVCRPGVVRAQQQVRPQQLVGLAIERLAHAIGEKTDGGQGRDSHHQSGGQQAQFAGTGVAAQHAPGKEQHVHVKASRYHSVCKSPDAHAGRRNTAPPRPARGEPRSASDASG